MAYKVVYFMTNNAAACTPRVGKRLSRLHARFFHKQAHPFRDSALQLLRSEDWT